MTDAEPLSVFQVVSSPWCTGAASAALDLACALRDGDHRVALAAVPGDALEARAREEGLSFEGFRFNRRFGPVDFLRDRRRLGRLIREAGVQVVHTHLPHDHWVALAARGGNSARVVRTFHLLRAIRGDGFHRSLCYNRTDGFLAVSEGIHERCIKTAGIPPERVRTLRGMVDTEFFRPGTGDDSAGAALGLNGEGPVVGTVSRLTPRRGHFSLLEAFAKVRNEFPTARLLITGKGEHREAILGRAGALGLGREVVLPGFWEGDLRDVFRQLRVFVLQSGGSEGTARALLEAMAYGLPCVVAAAEGLDEIVEDGETGAVIPPSDPQALAEAVNRLLREPDRAAALGVKARKRAEEFRRDLQAGRTVDFYRMLLNRAEPGERS